MYIYTADTGQAVEVNVPPGASVQNFKESIAMVTPIPLQDQILLVDGKRLDTHKSLEYYGLPSQDKEVFLFNRRAITDPNFPLPDGIALPQIDTIVPQMPPVPREYANRPLIHALKTYEHNFQSHYMQAQAIREAFEKRIIVCSNCFREMQIQIRGMDCAIINLDDHIRQLVHSHSDFISHTKNASLQNDELLNNFDSDMAKLKEVHLHPSHATPGMTLLDLVPEGRLRKWAEEGHVDNEHLKMRIPDMENQVRVLQQDVEMEKRKPSSVDFTELANRLTHGEEVLREILTRVQMFAKDYENCRKLCEEALRSSNPNVGSWCDGFDEISKVHESHLVALRQHDQASMENYVIFARSKVKLTQSVYTRLRAVSVYQSRARDQYNTMAVMSEALSRLKAAFNQLAIIKNMPHAYSAAVQEVARRRGFMKKVRREILKMNETFARIRAEEVPIRDSFMNTYYPYVPKDAFPGLLDPLPNLEVSLPPFDSNLPVIDSGSYDDDDFTLVPFNDDPAPKVQSFDRENAFSQSGSVQTNTNNNNNSNNPYTPTMNTSGNPAALVTSPSHTPSTPTSNPSSIPAHVQRGFTPTQVSGALSTSPPSSNLDTAKLQKELAVSKEAASSYAERIKQLELELNKMYKEKYEYAQHKLEGVQVGTPRSTQELAELRAQLREKDDIINSLRSELDNQREKEEEEGKRETSELQAKVFEQEQQIERLMTALHTQTQQESGFEANKNDQERRINDLQAGHAQELTRLREEHARERDAWAKEKTEAKDLYDDMVKQLNGELKTLREEKLMSSRQWDQSKTQLEKSQAAAEKSRTEWDREREDMNKTLNELRKDVAAAEEWQEELKREKGEGEKTIASLEQEKLALSATVAQKTEEVRRFAQQLDQLTQALEQIKEEKARLAGAARKSEMEKENLMDEKLELADKVTKLEEQKRKLQDEAATRADEKEALESSVQSTKANLTQMMQSSTALQEALEEAKSELERVRKARDHATARVEELTTQLKDMQRALEEARTQLNAAADERDKAKGESASVHKANDQATARVAELTAQLEETQHALADAYAQLAAAAGEREQARGESASVRKASDQATARVAELTAQLNDTQHALAGAYAQLAEAAAERDHAKEENTKLAQNHNEQMLEYEQKLHELSERHKQEVSDSYRTFDLEREELMNSNKATEARLHLQISEYENALKESMQDTAQGPQIAELRKDLAEQKAKVVEFQTRLQEMDATVQKYQRKEAELSEISQAIQKKNQMLEKRLQDADGQFQRAQQQLDTQAAVHKPVEDECKQLRAIIEELSETLRKHPLLKSTDVEQDDDITKMRKRFGALLEALQNSEVQRDQDAVLANNTTQRLQTELDARVRERDQLHRRLAETEGHLAAIEMSMAENVPNKITFSKFKANDVILFVRKEGAAGIYEAYNVGSPNYYLSSDCLQFYDAKQNLIVGQIVEILQNKASSRENPFKLPDGTEYYEVVITPL